jgi:hypothetical protein
MPSLVSEGASESPSVFASPITPAFASFPSGAAPVGPQERSNSGDSIVSNVGLDRAEQSTLVRGAQMNSPKNAAKRGRGNDEELSLQGDEMSRAKRHCGGKMDLKVLTN